MDEKLRVKPGDVVLVEVGDVRLRGKVVTIDQTSKKPGHFEFGIELMDEERGIVHWKQWYDGGKLVNFCVLHGLYDPEFGHDCPTCESVHADPPEQLDDPIAIEHIPLIVQLERAMNRSSEQCLEVPDEVLIEAQQKLSVWRAQDFPEEDDWIDLSDESYVLHIWLEPEGASVAVHASIYAVVEGETIMDCQYILINQE